MRVPGKEEMHVKRVLNFSATCFTCFCGQEFLSQSLHSAHVQQCLEKVMSSKKDIQVIRKSETTIEETTVIGEPVESAGVKHEVVELDDGGYKVIW